ncbi:hypothetical protein [Nonomuraea salmonea]|uniref:hypothetical protein n=1 Tax=Nonomuraea salmonea TaxID=46181 RepID=UPI002FEC02C7
MGLCEVCGKRRAEHQHHRDPRGMGGDDSALVNSPANALDLCLWCHEWIENHRTIAYGVKWLLRTGLDPREEPVLLASAYGQGWMLLDEHGGVRHG